MKQFHQALRVLASIVAVATVMTTGCAAPSDDDESDDTSIDDEATETSEQAVARPAPSCVKLVSANPVTHGWTIQNNCTTAKKVTLAIPFAFDPSCQTIQPRKKATFYTTKTNWFIKVC